MTKDAIAINRIITIKTINQNEDDFLFRLGGGVELLPVIVKFLVVFGF